MKYFNNAPNCTPVQIIKLLKCYDYQSCEHPDYYISDAKKVIKGLENVSIEKLEGFEEANGAFR